MKGCQSLAALAALLLAAPLPAEGLTRHVSHATVDTASNAGMQQLPRERLLWKKAVKEAGLDPEKISDFGKAAAKFPKSWVDQIAKMNHTKKFRFFFQGMGFSGSNRYHRAWLFRFVHKKFKPNVDFIRLTDQKRSGYMSMGRDFDFTNKGTEGGFIPTRAGLNQKAYFDKGYYQNMVQSNFTLCPGGQQPWSTRIYEAAMAKSIPIIHNEEHDFTLPDHADWLPKIGYTYLKGAEYDQKVIDDNYKLFIKYQTFIEGDNEPPGLAGSKQVASTAKASPAPSKKAKGGDNSTSGAGPAAHEGGKEINATNTTEAVAKTVEKADAKSDVQVSLRAKGTAATVDQAFEEAAQTEEGSEGAAAEQSQEAEGGGASEEAEGSANEEAQEDAAEAAEGEAQESAEEVQEVQEDTQEAAAAEDAREDSGEEAQEGEQAGGEEQPAEAGEAAGEEAAGDAEGEVVDAAEGGDETEYKEQSEEDGGDEEQPQAAQEQVSLRSKQTDSYMSGASRIDAGEAEDAADDSGEPEEVEEVEEVDAAAGHEEADADEQEAEPPVRARSRRSQAKRAQKFRDVAHKKNHRRK